MSKQEIVAILEIASFFLVAIDLYGQDRLNNTQNRLLTASANLKARITRLKEFEWKDASKGRFMRIIYLMNLLPTSFFVYGFILNNEKGISFAFVVSLIFFAAVVYGIALFPFLIVTAFAILIFLFLIEIINAMVVALVSIFRKYQMEGVFLFTGTVLFLVSKYFEIYYD